MKTSTFVFVCELLLGLCFLTLLNLHALIQANDTHIFQIMSPDNLISQVKTFKTPTPGAK